MKTEKPSDQGEDRKYPLLLAKYAFDLACEYGWKSNITDWQQIINQAIGHEGCGCKLCVYQGNIGWFIDIDYLPEEDKANIANALEAAEEDILLRGYESKDDECLTSSRYGKNLFYKLVFWSEHKADLKEFIQLLRQDTN